MGDASAVVGTASTDRDARFVFEIGELLRLDTADDELLFQVAERLGRYLGVSRVLFLEVDAGGQHTRVRRDYRDGLPSLTGVTPVESFSPETVRKARAGEIVVRDDTRSDGEYAVAYTRAGIEARVAVPLRKQGRWVATLLVTHHEARAWEKREITLIQLVAERAWRWYEQLEAVQALRTSERRFRALTEASAQVVWSLSANGAVREDSSSWRAFTGRSRED